MSHPARAAILLSLTNGWSTTWSESPNLSGRRGGGLTKVSHNESICLGRSSDRLDLAATVRFSLLPRLSKPLNLQVGDVDLEAQS